MTTPENINEFLKTKADEIELAYARNFKAVQAKEDYFQILVEVYIHAMDDTTRIFIEKLNEIIDTQLTAKEVSK
ncbi:MAG: hypothetical protein M1391_14570 [Bacteroidetes bacterium]|nr:hypothetical protein [Bacteroidota bacterium]